MPALLDSQGAAPWSRTWESWEGQPGRGGGLLAVLRRFVLRWPVMVALTFFVAVAVGTDITRPATNAGRLSDLQSFYQVEQTGISSCSGGLRDSLTALSAILTGTSTDRRTAESIAIAGAQACSPTSNGDLYDMATGVPPRTLSGFGLADANIQLYSWAFPGASKVQGEIDLFLVSGQGARSAAARRLRADLIALQRDGAHVQGLFDRAASRLGGVLTPLSPSISQPPPAVLGR